MTFTLALNTNPLVNRFAEPDDLLDAIAGGIGVRDIQLTHEFVDPGWPVAEIRRQSAAMSRALGRTGTRVTSGMTGPYGRLNHFGHPDEGVRRHYVEWFGTFAEIIGDLGGRAIGTQFAILTYRDYDDPIRREERIKVAIDCWAAVAERAKSAGLEFVFWEPMSVGREFGHTIQECLALQERLSAANMAVPMLMMADIDHGDVSSPDPDDQDPYAWARSTAACSPIVHVKQCMSDKSGHRPFTAEFNAKGMIRPEAVLAALSEGGGGENEICLELSFREREPSDREVIPQIAESVAYWSAHVHTGAEALRSVS